MGSDNVWGKWYTPKTRILFHILFWIGVLLLYSFTYERLVGQYYWIFTISDFMITSSLFYLASYIMPDFVSKGKVFPAFVFFLFAYIYWLNFNYFVCRFAINHIPSSEESLHRYFKIFLNDGYWGVYKLEKMPDFLLDFLFLVSLPLSIKLTKVIFDDAHKLTISERDRLRLERDNLQMELGILKSQISPHFVFNTLNSIYRMAEKQDVNTPAAILNLSNLLRHILYQTKDDLIYISLEIQFLNNFLELMKLRYQDSVRIEFNVERTKEPYQIVPLILIPFLENAIKHGPDRSRKNAWVKVELRVADGELLYNVSNSVNHLALRHQFGGLGLQNVKRRLDIYYKNRYSLDIIEDKDSYAIFLKIKLES